MSKNKCKQKAISFPKVPVSCCASAASDANGAANRAKVLIKGAVCLTDSQVKIAGTLAQQYDAYKNVIRKNKCKQTIIPPPRIPASCCVVAISGMNSKISSILAVTKGKRCIGSSDATKISSYVGSYNKFKKDFTARKCTQIVLGMPAIPRMCSVFASPPQVVSALPPPVDNVPPPHAINYFLPPPYVTSFPPPPYDYLEVQAGPGINYITHSDVLPSGGVVASVMGISGTVLTVTFDNVTATPTLPNGTKLRSLTILEMHNTAAVNDSYINAINTVATYIAAQVTLAMTTAGKRKQFRRTLLDNPGCDLFPDTACTIPCCAHHDKCYNDNGCSFSSWIDTISSQISLMPNDPCNNCNQIVATCVFATANTDCSVCAGSAPPGQSCYDHACDAFYDCPGGCPCHLSSTPSKGCCECESPCRTPAPTPEPTPAPTPEPTPVPERGCGGPQDPGGLPCVPTPEPTVAPTPAQACKPQFYNNYWFTINEPSNPVTCPFICDPTREGGGVCVSIDINMCDGTVIKDACNFVQHVQPYLDPNVCYYDPCTGKHVPKP